MWPSARRSSARIEGPRRCEMRKRLVALMLVVLTVMLVTAMTPARLRGQGAARPQVTLTLPRTPDGKPDLQGVWFFVTLTPLVRPANLAGRTELNDDEIAAMEQRNADTSGPQTS